MLGQIAIVHSGNEMFYMITTCVRCGHPLFFNVDLGMLSRDTLGGVDTPVFFIRSFLCKVFLSGYRHTLPSVLYHKSSSNLFHFFRVDRPIWLYQFREGPVSRSSNTKYFISAA